MFLVPCGTAAEVVKPNGVRMKFTCRKNLVFAPAQSELIGVQFHFKLSGYTLIVWAGKVQNAWAMP